MRTSLGSAGDEDEMDVIRELESVFAFRFRDEDLINMRTVRDIDSAVWNHLREHHLHNKKCMSAMAFYVLRRAVQKAVPGRRIKLGDHLSSLGLSPKALKAHLHRETGLTLRIGQDLVGDIGASLLLIALLAVIPGAVFLPAPYIVLLLLAGASGMLLIRYDKGRYADDGTCAGAVRSLCLSSYGLLALKGARVDEQTAFAAVRSAIAVATGITPDEIGEETFLLAKRGR
jgi:hypothetical protein